MARGKDVIFGAIPLTVRTVSIALPAQMATGWLADGIMMAEPVMLVSHTEQVLAVGQRKIYGAAVVRTASIASPMLTVIG